MTYSEQLNALFKDALRYKKDINRCERELLKLQSELYEVSLGDVCLQIVMDIRHAEMLCDGRFTLYSAVLLSRNGWCFPCIDSPVLSKTINGHKCTIYWFSKGVSSVVIDHDYKCFSKWIKVNSAIIHCNSLQFILNSTC